MFDIGFAELLVVAVVALLVLGPEKLPMAARTCGLWLGRVRRTVSNIQREINEELRVEEMRRTTAINKEKLDEELSEMRKPFSTTESDAAVPESRAEARQDSKPGADEASLKKSTDND
ncbi:Twin-arginine translocation protein TatB [Marinobacterium lacunae]|uniref:Sec-independent protein translocase protein TatB n=1 Tax=Marinobacterium lacunae TaxID=1232683 RepID=A0A081FV44_9GAMM|nr:Sec-independent protein translocase protein TatB [Marinobacterium lacunae]KEA62399.1 Twin-arginine translocation protein TatB [Marinobacterium lacunae]MBR9884924.1 twin-arginine translocase subunit TatB [Oceanospirillales bacterium]